MFIYMFAVFFLLSYYFIYLVITEKSYPDFYHTPSQPISKNSSSSYLSSYLMSGIHVMGCLWNGIPAIFLCEKSPIDLVKFNPFTLPAIICIPQFYILSF